MWCCYFSVGFDFVSCTYGYSCGLLLTLVISIGVIGWPFPPAARAGLRDQRPDWAASDGQRHDGEAPLARARLAEGGFRTLQEGIARLPLRQLRRRRKGDFVGGRYSMSDVGCPIIDVRYSIFYKGRLIVVRYLIPGTRYSIVDTRQLVLDNRYAMFVI